MVLGRYLHKLKDTEHISQAWLRSHYSSLKRSGRLQDNRSKKGGGRTGEKWKEREFALASSFLQVSSSVISYLPSQRLVASFI